MDIGLSPIRLTGGLCLSGRRLTSGDVAIAGDRFAEGGGREVDASGHILLPGIVDLRASGWIGHMPPGRPRPADVARAVAAAADSLARNGVTTAWISAGWSRADAYATPEMAEAVVATVADLRERGAPLDLSARIEADTHLTDEADRLVALIARPGIAHVALRPMILTLQDLAEGDAPARSAWARAHAVPTRAIGAAAEAAAAASAHVPRHICRVAAACDAAGIGFSSHGDRDAEAREHYRMLGARMADTPRTRAAVTAARAMGDPVILDARDVVGSARQQGWVADGLVDALATGDVPSSGLRAALALDACGLVPFPEAWALVSARPAAVMARPDRGAIAPGLRADFVVLDARTRHVAATISGGRLVAGQGALADRIAGMPLAAE
ncbi:hypothetical protein HKCCE2091_20605 [Rhodobacterales bacterium HKCCE2091]|nr:hypothetical protein [Rhodobacterales bacterium HKCCE2091]